MNTKDLIIQDDFSKQLMELDKIQETCKKLLQTRHYASMGEAGIHAIISKAKALGIHPFEALNGGFHCINGKVGMSTEMMAALIRKRGHSITKDSKSDNECVILHGKRVDSGDTWTCTFSKQDAITAGLWNGPTWKKYPGVMLYNRCMSMLFRQLFPDLSLGAGYVEDELKEIAKVDEYKLPVSECEDITKHPEYVSIPAIEVIEDKPKEKIVKYINKAQIVMYNENYDKCTEEVRKKINDAFFSLNINDLSEMEEKTWIKFMKAFDQYLKPEDKK